MNKVKIYFIAASVLLMHHAFCMEEKKESQEKPTRIIKISPDNKKETRFISVSEKETTALIVSSSNYSGPYTLRWYDLLNNKLIKEFTSDNYYPLSEGFITDNGPMIILVKNKFLDQNENKETIILEETESLHSDIMTPPKKTVYSYFCESEDKKILYSYNIQTDKLSVINYTARHNDDFTQLSDNQTAIDISGIWKAIAIPNKKAENSQIILCDDNNNVVHTFIKKPANYLRAYLSHDANQLITWVSNEHDGLGFDLYDITRKNEPAHIKKLDLKSFYCYFSQKNNLFCDYKIIYNGKTGEITETPELDTYETLSGFSEKNYIIAHQGKKALFMYDKKNNTRTDLTYISDERIAIKATPLNNNTEFAIYPLFPWENNPTEIYIYAVSKDQESTKQNSGYFSNCLIN